MRLVLLRAAMAGIVALAGLALLTLQTGAQRSGKPMSDGSDQIREIETTMGIRVPEGVAVRLLQRESDGDPLLQAVLTMPQAAFEAMAAQNGWPRDEFRPENFRLLGLDHGGWTPRARPPFPVYARPVQNGRYLYVGRDEEDGTVVVYLSWFRT